MDKCGCCNLERLSKPLWGAVTNSGEKLSHSLWFPEQIMGLPMNKSLQGFAPLREVRNPSHSQPVSTWQNSQISQEHLILFFCGEHLWDEWSQRLGTQVRILGIKQPSDLLQITFLQEKHFYLYSISSILSFPVRMYSVITMVITLISGWNAVEIGHSLKGLEIL